MEFDVTLDSYISRLSKHTCLFTRSPMPVPAATTATTTLIHIFRPWPLQHDFLLSRGLEKLAKVVLLLSVTFFIVSMIGFIFISGRIVAYCERCAPVVVTMILFCILAKITVQE